MPELPEMENYKRLLTPLTVHRSIVGTVVRREKSINVPVAEWERRVAGKSIVSLQRRAKHLLFGLDSGDVLNLHLMLGGKLFFGTERQKPDRTVQVELKFTGGTLFFIGLRLGYLHVHSAAEIEQVLSGIGPEPLEAVFTEERFAQCLDGKKRGVLKTVLVDQHVIAGIGNCYCDEICFDAAVKPLRKIASLERNEVARLYHSMLHVLQDAAANGGYMDLPLYEGDTLTGNYDSRCRVYDCEGQACVRCGHSIVRDEFASRKVFYCPNCQR